MYDLPSEYPEKDGFPDEFYLLQPQLLSDPFRPQPFNLEHQNIRAILLDIEGTVAPIQFVAGVLFPFAQTHLYPFMTEHGSEPEVQQDLALLLQDHQTDVQQGLDVPAWNSRKLAGLDYLNFLIESDRKSTGLKSLQGKIWDQGYRCGELKSQLFADTKPAFERWTQAGIKLFIFSSGSVQAQKLLFKYTEVGDLSPYLSGYFDTVTGPKKEAGSYEAIAENIGIPCEKILFISDIEAELIAAQTAGMHSLLSIRPGNYPITGNSFLSIHTLDQVF